MLAASLSPGLGAALGAGTAAGSGTSTVLAWGANGSGQLGDNSNTGSDVPVKTQIPSGTTVTAIAAGQLHRLALTSTGSP